MKNNYTWYYDNNVDLSGDKAILYLNEFYGIFQLFPTRIFVESVGESWDREIEYMKNILNQHGSLYYSYVPSEKVTPGRADLLYGAYTLDPFGDLVDLLDDMCKESLQNCPDELNMTAQHAYYEEMWQ